MGTPKKREPVAPKKPTRTRTQKIDERARLLTQLGEELWALFQTKALPVPAKLRDTVESLRKFEEEKQGS